MMFCCLQGRLPCDETCSLHFLACNQEDASSLEVSRQAVRSGLCAISPKLWVRRGRATLVVRVSRACDAVMKQARSLSARYGTSGTI